MPSTKVRRENCPADHQDVDDSADSLEAAR